MNKQEKQADLMVEGFHKLDDTLIHPHAPKIKYLPGFTNKNPENQIKYLKALAATMNHAAKLIQEERDALNGLMILKEQQLISMSAQVEANNQMLQFEVTRMNEQRQAYNKLTAKMCARIRELERNEQN